MIDNPTPVVAFPKLSFSQASEFSVCFLANPYEIWIKGGLVITGSVLRMAFAQPLGFSIKRGLQTPETTFPFKALRLVYERLENGAPSRDRTRDPLITNQVLYHLSYRGVTLPYR